MAEEIRPIVIKRKKVVAGGAHGGVWKLAYADFMTAMMAFFLLMWLLGSTAAGDLKGIADFFQNPLKVGMGGGSGAGDAKSILQGGGKDLTRRSGQVKNGDVKKDRRRESLKERQEEGRRLENLKTQIEGMIAKVPELMEFRNQLLLDFTAEGLRIQIIDEHNRPMFDLSSAELKPHARTILQRIGMVLNAVNNRISLSGHTDASRYSGDGAGFTNWELSANRANASRRELILGGMDENKILRVVGLASTVLYDQNDPLNPANRRISIVVLNKRAEEAILQETGPETAVTDEATEALPLLENSLTLN